MSLAPNCEIHHRMIIKTSGIAKMYHKAWIVVFKIWFPYRLVLFPLNNHQRATYIFQFNCSSCKVVKYCDRICQEMDWHLHKVFCKGLANPPPNTFDGASVLALYFPEKEKAPRLIRVSKLTLTKQCRMIISFPNLARQMKCLLIQVITLQILYGWETVLKGLT